VKASVDTNIIVSGLLRSQGAPAHIIRRIAAGDVQVCYDERIIAEYREVLLRPRLELDEQLVATLLNQIETGGVPVVCEGLDPGLPDPDDNMFIEAAIAGGAACLVTGNLRHYPPERCEGVMVLTPRQFVDAFPPK
jgi:putative PIN family toxin of toxin-antitoxin system